LSNDHQKLVLAWVPIESIINSLNHYRLAAHVERLTLKAYCLLLVMVMNHILVLTALRQNLNMQTSSDTPLTRSPCLLFTIIDKPKFSS